MISPAEDPDLLEEWVERSKELRQEGHNQTEVFNTIADEYDTGRTTVRYWMRKNYKDKLEEIFEDRIGELFRINHGVAERSLMHRAIDLAGEELAVAPESRKDYDICKNLIDEAVEEGKIKIDEHSSDETTTRYSVSWEERIV